MSDNGNGSDIGDDTGTAENGAAEISAADEQALRAMFAALVADAAPSELSALAVQRQARIEQHSGSDHRARRLTVTRNVLIAAVLAGVVALVVPRLVGSSTETATTAGSSSSAAAATSSAAAAAAAPAAAPVPSAASASGAYGASSRADGEVPPSSAGPAGGSNAPASGAASSVAAAGGSAAAASSGSEATNAASGVEGDSTSAASSEASSSAPASSSAAAAADLNCPPISAGALAKVKAALPGYRGTLQISSCSTRVRSPVAAGATGTVTFVVSRTGSATCARSGTDCPTVPGTRIPGTKDAYAYSTDIVVAGSRGITVTISSPPGGPDRSALIAAARVLVKNLG